MTQGGSDATFGGIRPLGGRYAQVSSLPSIKRAALDRVADFLLSCVDESVPRPGIFPTPEGGIQLEWPGPELVEIEFGPDGQITAFLGEAEYQYPVTAELDDLLSGLRQILQG